MSDQEGEYTYQGPAYDVEKKAAAIGRAHGRMLEQLNNPRERAAAKEIAGMKRKRIEAMSISANKCQLCRQEDAEMQATTHTGAVYKICYKCKPELERMVELGAI